MNLFKSSIREQRKRALVILAYHRVCELTGLYYDRNISATPEEFARQMKYLKAKYSVISGRDLVGYYCHGGTIPDNSIIITFDDGFKDTFINALPVLKENKLPAVVFIATDFIDGRYTPWEDELAYLVNSLNKSNLTGVIGLFKMRDEVSTADELLFALCRKLRKSSNKERNELFEILYRFQSLSKSALQDKILHEKKGMMDINDIKQWVSAGYEIGSHTCSHLALSDGTEPEIIRELTDSKLILEKITNNEAALFAYPYGMNGYYNESSILLTEKAEYKCAVNLRAGINTVETNRYDLNRMGVGRNLKFKNTCKGWQ